MMEQGGQQGEDVRSNLKPQFDLEYLSHSRQPHQQPAFLAQEPGPSSFPAQQQLAPSPQQQGTPQQEQAFMQEGLKEGYGVGE